MMEKFIKMIGRQGEGPSEFDMEFVLLKPILVLTNAAIIVIALNQIHFFFLRPARIII